MKIILDKEPYANMAQIDLSLIDDKTLEKFVRDWCKQLHKINEDDIIEELFSKGLKKKLEVLEKEFGEYVIFFYKGNKDILYK